VILIHVPDLNDRIEDIPVLCDYFIDLICTEYRIPPKVIEAEAISELQKMRWTGNIREFRNVIERLIILCDKTITKEDVLNYAIPQQ
jgi:DNA-binding NtrC family response regulator